MGEAGGDAGAGLGENEGKEETWVRREHHSRT